jgi:urea carboxylase-associated protein 2
MASIVDPAQEQKSFGSFLQKRTSFLSYGRAMTHYKTHLPGGKHWSFTMREGSTLRLTDIEGNGNAGMLLYNPQNLLERYNAPDTLKCQHTFHLTKGHCLYSDMGRVLCGIIADDAGWHDTVCGTTTRAMIDERWGRLTYQQALNDFRQSGQEAFLVEALKYGLSRRDMAANVNWFSKVIADDSGNLAYVPNHSQPGNSLILRFEMDTLVLLHTCPHPMNPSETYPSKPIGLEIAAAPPEAAVSCKTSAPENGRGFANNAIYHQHAAHPC